MSKNREKSSFQADMTLLTLVVLLTVLGLVILFSASEYNGRVRFHDSAYYFRKQLFASSLGLGVMYFVSNISYRFFVLSCSGGIFPVYAVINCCTPFRAGDQWLKTMAEPWTVIFPAIRICQSSCCSFSDLAD